MKSLKESRNQIDIDDFYSLKIKALWAGLKQQHISFWFLCIYFLFEYIRPQAQYPVINILPWGMTFLLLTLITSFMNKSIVWVSNPINKLFILLGIIIILSGVFAFNPEMSWSYKEVMLGWIIVYFLVINIVNSEKRVILFLLAYLLFNLKMAQFGSIHWVRQGFAFSDTGLNGAPGWFQNSGEYAIQMIIYGSLALALVISLKEHWGRYKKWIFYIAAIMGYFAVMGASSRGSQIALAAIAIWFTLKQKNGFKGLLVMAVISIALYYLLPEEQLIRFSNIGEDNSSLQRYAYWIAGVEAMKEHPVLGVGYRNWVPYMWDKYPDGLGPGENIQVSHNIYVEAGSELGLTGLFIFLLLIIFAFINNSRTRKMAKQIENNFLYVLTYGLDAGLIGFLVAGSFVTVLYYPFFWIQIAMIVMLNSVTKNQWVNMLDQTKNNHKSKW